MKRNLFLIFLASILLISIFVFFGIFNKEDKSPQIAIVLDDFGYTKKNLEALKRIRVPITLAVLPDTQYAREVSFFAVDNGFEVILHMPMEPEGQEQSLEKSTILNNMSREDVEKRVIYSLLSVPFAVGVNNHMGSKLTKNPVIMAVILKTLKDNNMFFLDSVTSGSSVCAQVAGASNIPFAKRDIFLDNKLEEGCIQEQMIRASEIAEIEGLAVVIGHDREVTISTLEKVIPAMKEKGFKFVKVSEIVK